MDPVLILFGVVLVLLVAAQIIVRRRIHVTNQWLARTNARLDRAARIIAKTATSFAGRVLDSVQVQADLAVLATLTEAQRIDPPPGTSPTRLSDQHLLLMILDLQQEKLRDLLATNGQNLGDILASEERQLAQLRTPGIRRRFDSGR